MADADADADTHVDAGWPTGPVTLTEPASLRAISHPARLTAVQELFGRRVDRTATELASVAGGTPSAMSYHLRALERHGLVQRSSAGRGADGRERRWRAAGTSLSIESSAHAEGFGGEVVATLGLDRATRSYRAWARTRRAPDDPESVHTGTVLLTDDEARELLTRLDAAVEDLLPDRAAADAPPGARPFRWLWAAFPDARDVPDGVGPGGGQAVSRSSAPRTSTGTTTAATDGP